MRLHSHAPSTRRARLAGLLLVLAIVTPPAPASLGYAPAKGKRAPARMASSHRAPASPPAIEDAQRPGELLMRFRADASEQRRDAVVTAAGARRGHRLRGGSQVEKIDLTAGQDLASVVAQLSADPAVEFAEPNFTVHSEQSAPNDQRFGEQWALRNSGQAGGQSGADIGADGAWRATTGAPETVIAVLDSGVDFTHLDLARNRWANARERVNGRDDDHDGFTDDLYGWDWIADSNQAVDQNGHGTAVAGIIAAEGNNGRGVAGVLWRASLMSLRVLDQTGTGDVAAAVEAIDYAAAHGAQVINISWGTDAESVALKDSITRAGARGVLVVCAAGNSGRNADGTPYYPAAFELPNIVAVAATDSADNLTVWSNWGVVHVAVGAPGVNILTTKRGGSYWTVSGTSAAAPLVSGVAGLVKTVNPALDAPGVRAAIIGGARRVVQLDGKVSSGGVVSAAGALAALSTLGTGGGNGNSGGSGNSGNGQGSGQGNGQPPGVLPTPGVGGTQGNGNRFGVTPPEPTKEAPPGFVNQDEARRQRLPEPVAPTFIRAAVLPDCNVGCGGADPPGAAGPDPYFATARNRAENRTGGAGVDLLSRNFTWGIPLVSLPGRAGLDMSIGLYYNSSVWIKQGSAIMYNADHGFPGPGFRLGFPTLQPRYYNSDVGMNAYTLVAPSGNRVEMRQVGASSVYDSADGAYTQLTENADGSRTVRTSDGTQFMFKFNGYVNEYRCWEIKDRNGNYITINYGVINNNYGNYDSLINSNIFGRPTSIIDTLGRTITFNYDGQNYLTSITQAWRRETLTGVDTTPHVWATFNYGTVTLQPNFRDQNNNPLTTYATTGTQIPVLTSVGLADSSYYEFFYEGGWGMVNRINQRAPNRLLNYTTYNIPATGTSQTDCPRFTVSRAWAQFWNGDADAAPVAAEEAVTTFSSAADNSWCKVVLPDGTMHKELYATSGWQKGLVTGSEDWTADEGAAGGLMKKWVTTSWTQDNTGLSYWKNPRVVETNVYDSDNNRRRTTVGYVSVTAGSTTYSLPETVREYDRANPNLVLRRTAILYKWDQALMDKHVIGLVGRREVYEGESTLVSRVDYVYDWVWGYMDVTAPAVQHDIANYGSSFYNGRGILVAVFHYDANNTSQGIWAQTFGYNLAGQTVWTGDALGHRTNLSYADSFSDGVNRPSTLAYPTTVTDPDGYASTMQYNYDMGVVTRTQDPKGAVRTMLYDTAGRRERITVPFNSAYTRREYDIDNGHTRTYSTVDAGLGETYNNTIVDGTGQVRLVVLNHPNSTGGYRAVWTQYDNMGRVKQQSNVTEITGGGTPTGDDAAGYQWTLQAYDWKGRPTLTTYPKLNPTDQLSPTSEFTYGGCGCAGGAVVTTRDEVGRQQKVYDDALGRVVKTEQLDLSGTIYSTTTRRYNVLDQVTRVRVYPGMAPGPEPEGEGTAYQTSTATYDGYGRLATSKKPIQGGPVSYAYDNDGTLLSTTDPRGVVTSYGFTNAAGYTNKRHLVNSITYTNAPSEVPVPTQIRFEYDAVGNRTRMSDESGSVDYVYNTLSQLTSETRQFAGLNGSYPLTYGYTLSGQLKSITYHTTEITNYGYDSAGRLLGVSGSGPGAVPSYVSNLRYRAWGAPRDLDYGNTTHSHYDYNARLLPTGFAVSNVKPAALDTYPSGNIPAGTQSATMTWTYDYYADGRPHHVYDSALGRFTRAYDYDHVGRLKEAYSGLEAQGLPADTYRQQVPYRQTMSYDVWGNTTSLAGRLYSRFQNDSGNYANDRRQGFTYDAAGNVTQDRRAHTFDAAGRHTQAVANASGDMVGDGSAQYPYQPSLDITQAYDGDGRAALRDQITREDVYFYNENNEPIYSGYDVVSDVRFYVRSNVLGGAVALELNAQGQQIRRNVYAAGQRVARQEGGVNTYEHHNPVTGGWLSTASDRLESREERDPLGAELPLNSPDPSVTYVQMKAPQPLYIEGSDPFDRNSGYEVDGMPVSRAELERMTENGSLAVEISVGTSTPVRVGVPSRGLGYIPSHIDITRTRIESRLRAEAFRAIDYGDEPLTHGSINFGWSLRTAHTEVTQTFSFSFGGVPQTTTPAGQPSQKLPGCTFNVSLTHNNLLDSKQIQVMKDEVSRIFATAGQEINFVSSNADYYLNINARGSTYTNKSDAVGLTYLSGSAVTNNGRVFVDRLTDSATSDASSARAFNQNSSAIAIGLGRAGSHEVAHYLLQQNYDSSRISGVMHDGFKGSQWFSSSAQGLWTFTPAQIKQLNSLCGR